MFSLRHFAARALLVVDLSLAVNLLAALRATLEVVAVVVVVNHARKSVEEEGKKVKGNEKRRKVAAVLGRLGALSAWFRMGVDAELADARRCRFIVPMDAVPKLVANHPANQYAGRGAADLVVPSL